MKKIITLLFVFLLILTGCGEKNDNTINTIDYSKEPEIKTICKRNLDYPDSNFTLDSQALIYSRAGVVTREEDKEIMTSSDLEKLTKYKAELDNQYESDSNTYGGTSYNVVVQGNQTIAEVTIDYSKYNIDKFAENFYIYEDEIVDGFVKLDVLKELYENYGYNCQ